VRIDPENGLRRAAPKAARRTNAPAEEPAHGDERFQLQAIPPRKGERVGLYAAGGIALLMIVLSLFWPHKGLLSDSPKASAEAITKVAKDKKDQAGTAGPGTLAPSDAEKKNLREVDPQL